MLSCGWLFETPWRVAPQTALSMDSLGKNTTVGSNPTNAAAAAAASLQSCLTLCDPVDGSPPGSPIPGILQARVLEWVAIAYSENPMNVVPETDVWDKIGRESLKKKWIAYIHF